MCDKRLGINIFTFQSKEMSWNRRMYTEELNKCHLVQGTETKALEF